MSEEFTENSPEETNIQIEFYKKQLIKLGFFVAVIVVLCGLMLALCLTSKKSYSKGLKAQVNSILNKNSFDDMADKEIKFSSLLSTTASAWQLKNNPDSYVFIIRVTTIYSSVPCVFIYDSVKDKADFIDFSEISAKARKNIKQSGYYNQINYWKNKIPSLVKANISHKEEK
ncbi:hypothetical protein [Treponema sp.]|uniref:hypothetical protein n=1 Tax=Treponema sp. TaxID=166 RepID=UPI0025D1D785|nr:hypothetical protein [Treponema sp.]MCR5217350.1 hypothetical protein [Treponema sp.]